MLIARISNHTSTSKITCLNLASGFLDLVVRKRQAELHGAVLDGVPARQPMRHVHIPGHACGARERRKKHSVNG